MKVLMVADARSVHTRRWAVSLRKAGLDIVLYSIFPVTDGFFGENGISVYVFDLFTYKNKSILKSAAGMLSMHRKAVKNLKSVIEKEAPDVLHAHYATSFGLIAALTGFHPFVMSVWGSDVYEFPYQSPLNRLSVKYILRKADKVLSTSHVMAKQTSRFTSRSVEVIPFGVDTSVFRPFPTADDGTFLIGNVKTLSYKYGIDVLVNAFRIIKDSNPGRSLRLMIVGDGPSRKEYEELVTDLGLSDDVIFAGRVANDMLPWYYNSFSVAVSLSRSESFGVVAVEAMACGCPVVTSDAEGFTEVVSDNETGFIVPRNDPRAAAAAVQRLIDNPDLRKSMGKNGIARVAQFYDWNYSIRKMLKVYTDVRRS